ncbi:MAG: glycosyltransferase [Calditrichaeota bacterium]|nr:glycosyltransferase [Calditrichota bacterium]
MTYFIHSLLLFLGLIYIYKIGTYFLGLLRLTPGTSEAKPTFQVLIPARNEEDTIASCLNSILNQTYSKDRYKVAVIDDHSTDRTSEIVEKFVQNYPGRVQLFHYQKNHPHKAYKKAAIQYGIEHTQGEIIATIDADCVAQPTWLEGIARHYDDDVGMVSGYILIHPAFEKTLFHKIQSLEFLGLVTTGAGAIGIGHPVISNGANLSYRRRVFEEVDGFRDIDNVPSGDDDLLMQKIHHLTSWRIRFAIEKNTNTYTRPVETLKAFLNQRTRWASKSAHYRQKSLVAFLVSVYLYYFLLFLWPVWLLLGGAWDVLLLGFLLKWGVDYLVTQKGAAFTRRKDLLKYFLFAQFFQIPYILWVGAKGLTGHYEWKGRQNNSRD